MLCVKKIKIKTVDDKKKICVILCDTPTIYFFYNNNNALTFVSLYNFTHN